MTLARLSINSLSGGVGRQAPTKRLNSESENIDNCLVTIEKSIEKRPPLSFVSSGSNACYLNVNNLNPVTTFSNGGATNFNPDNLYIHWLDIDGYNRYCIIINRAGYTFNPVSNNSFTLSGQTIKLDNFITVYRIEPTEWIQEVVDDTFGTTGSNTSGFNRGIFEYLTYGNKVGSNAYKVAGTTITESSSSSIKDTFGSIDFDVGLILWNRLILLDYLPDHSTDEVTSYTSTTWQSSFASNEFIHSGDIINYKRTAPPTTLSPSLEDTIDSISGYWTNVRDDIINTINDVTLEVEELGQNLENFEAIPQYPATLVFDDLKDFNGYKAWRTLNAYYDNPKMIPIPGGTIDWTKDHYYKTSPLTAEQRDVTSDFYGLGKIYFARNPYLTFPAGFYRATRYTKNPYFERIRSEGPNTVFDHRRFPVIIYKDTATDGKWRIKEMPLFPRRSGTSVSNPGPVSLQKKESVQSMAIWKGRLWVATDNNIFTSRTNSYYNFWVDDISNITASDPIDIQASVGAYNKLSHIIPFQNILFALSSGSVQFEVRGNGSEGGISPFSVEFRPTSFYSTSKLVAPQKMGNNIFFMNSSKVYMYLSGSSFNDEYSTSMEVSSHCRGYLPTEVGALTVSSGVNTMLAVDDDVKNHIYLFTFRTNGDKVMQQAFHRWILSPLDEIIGLKSYEKDLYLISKRPTVNSSVDKLAVYFTSLESVNVETPMIDWLYKVPTPIMSYVGGIATLTLPFYDPEIDTVLTAEEWGNNAFANLPVNTVFTDGITGLTKVTVTGVEPTFPLYVGRSYEMNIELSQQVYRSSKGGTAETVIEGVLNLKRITTRHLNSGSYDIEIERRGRVSNKTTFFPTDLNSLVDLNSELKIDYVGEHLVKVLSYSEACKIFIKSSYPTPCNISNVEILGTFRSRNTSIE
jgi:hypothetical protein